ncbi:response regulator [Aureicoccus marinus]|uniref:response regulator n=1 Tax=Aureicoccus marinus TaxID=754435 RepID=UPI000CF547CA|nr:response regulator transcription factor [Aureicoccus marinus]
MNTRIAITDDHQMVLEGVVAMLKGLDGIEVVGTYNSAQETLDNIQKDEATLLLLDVNLPDINGIDLAKMLLKDQPELKIIALTNFEDISFVKRMLKNGVHGTY